MMVVNKMYLLLSSFLLVLVQNVMCQFKDQPTGGTILVNQEFTLSCSVYSPFPPSMAWFKDTEERGVDFADARINITYDSSTGVSTYTLISAVYNDAGEYSCESRSELGAPIATSDTATVVVHGTPTFSSLMQPSTISVGGTATFSCMATAVPSATITWSFNGQTITSGGQFTITDVSLIISNVQMSNAGFYKCTATNTYGTNSTSARLTVTAAPVNPTVTITEGSEVTVGQTGSTILHCTVTGNDITFIRWTKSGIFGELTDGVSKSSDGATLTLSNVIPSDGGVYTCTASSTGGGTGFDSISVNVVALPQISVSPSSVTKLSGETLTDSEAPTCTLTGGTQGDIVWRAPSGVEVPHVSGRMNIARPLTVSDDGVYQCVAANLAGTATQDFALTVNAIPTFTIRPEDVKISYGQNIFIACEATGNPTPIIVWAKSGGPLQQQSVILPGGIQLYSVASSDQGTYTCTAANSVGTNSTSAVVTVTIPPHINSILPSNDYYVNLGDGITISCNVSSQPGSTVVWYHNGTVIPQSGRIQRLQLSSSLWSLSIAGSTYKDSGVYTCNITNTFVFDFVSLNVIVGIKTAIISGPSDINVTQNQEAFLPCHANGIPQPLISWYKTEETDQSIDNETQLATFGPSYRIEDGGLRLLNTRRNDSGHYRCLADNRVGTDSQLVRVRVEGAPLAVSISPTLFIAGNTAYINCHIHYDFPQVTFQWLETATNQLLFPPRFTTLPNGTLIVSPIQGGDHKEISCRVSNQYGSSTVSQFITVHVHPQPSFSVSDGVIGILDDSFSFSCSGTGRPTPSLSLYTPDGGEADEAAFDPSTGIFTTGSFQVAQSGMYICSANNTVGLTNASLSVEIRGAPPRLAIVNPLGSREISVAWNSPEPQFLSKLLSYSISYGIADLSERVVINSIGTTSFVSGLEEYTEYLFEVRGVFAGGVEGLSVNATGVTFEAAPSGSPQNISLAPLTEALEVSWTSLQRFDKNGIILNYTIYYRETPDNSSVTPNYTSITYVVPSSHSEEDEPFIFTLRDLKGGKSYDIKMQAFTSVGGGPNSSVVREETLRAFPLVLVLSITIPVAVIALVALSVLIFFLSYKCYVKVKKARLYSPKKGEAAYGKKKKKGTKKKKAREDVSNPVPDIPPKVDGSSKGKFSLKRTDGTTIPSNPRVIQPGDVAKKKKSGAKVVSVKNKRESALSSEFDPYDDPDDTQTRRQRKPKQSQSRDGFAPRDSKTSGNGIYETPADPKPKKKKPAKNDDDDDEDSLVEMPIVIKPRHGKEAEEESEEEEIKPVKIKPKHGGEEEEGESDDEIKPVAIKPKHGKQAAAAEEEESDGEIKPVVIKPKHDPAAQRKRRQQDDDDDDDDDDLPVEKPVSVQPRHTKQQPKRRQQLEVVEESEEDEDEDDEEEEEEEESDDDDQKRIYSRVPPAHIQKKRSKMLEEKMKADEKKRKEKEKIMAKMRKEKEKAMKKAMEQRKKQMKKVAEMKKKQMSGQLKRQSMSQLKRQSMGLDNVVSLRDIDTRSHMGRQLRYSMESSSADMF